MTTACDCGMAYEARERRTRCHECGTPGCPSCSVEFDQTRYCRWCATTTALARPA